jgi:Tol biopolymer transport system component
MIVYPVNNQVVGMTKPFFIRFGGSVLAILVLSGRIHSADIVGVPNSGSVPSDSANSDSMVPLLSADGAFALFTSQANNLVTNDNNGLLLDVFVRDLVNNVTTLISVTPDGANSGNGISLARGISSNNQSIVFESRASNLVTNDSNSASDIFVRDRNTGTTTLVSVNRFGSSSGDGGSINPEMTPDGRFVAFESIASDLVENDTNGVSDVFLRDLQLATTTLISVASNGVNSASGRSMRPAISADGKIVAFVSKGLDLAPGNNNTTNELYVRDLAAAVTTMIDISPPFPAVPLPRVEVYSHVLSSDGQRLAFLLHSANTNAVKDGIYYADLLNHTNYLVATNLNTANTFGIVNLAGPSMSSDGMVLAFEASSVPYVWETVSGNATAISSFGNAPVLSSDGRRVAFVGFDTNNPSAPNSGRRQLLVFDRAGGTTKLATADPSGNPSTDSEFPAASLSADGSRVAFQSVDGNLVPHDANRAIDVFVRDVDAAATALVSQRAPTLASLTGYGSSLVGQNFVSSDGRFVVFVSDAANLVANDTNGLGDVFVRDLTAGSNALVSINATGTASGSGISRDPVISADGRYVAFVSGAFDIVNNDTNALDDVFLRDLQSGTTILVSINRNHTASANGTSSKPSLSADGRLVVFQSRADDVVTNDFNNNNVDVVLFDAIAGSNCLVSIRSLGGSSGSGPSEEAIITPTGEWVIFQSKATDLLDYTVNPASYQFYARNLASDRTIPVSRGASTDIGLTLPRSPAVSADGNWVAFAGGSGGTNLYLCDLRLATNMENTVVALGGFSPSINADGRFTAYRQVEDPLTGRNQVWVFDRQTGTQTLVSARGASGGGGNGDSSAPVISGDGRYVVFKSQASDLVSNDANGWSDIFVRDSVTGTTLLVSAAISGTGGGNQLSSAPVIGSDGRTVVFHSFASELADGDRNNNRDVFLIRLGSGDSDGDGLPDDWEVAYFGDLSHDGASDSDGDGVTDINEYRAGTNPTSDTSVFKVLSITSLSTGATTVTWNAVSGKSYRLQYKDNLADGWRDLSSPVTLANGQGSAVDTATSSSSRFYRAVSLP